MNGTTPIAQAGIGNPGPTWKVVGAADFNADGRDDILLQNTVSGNLMVDIMNGTSVTTPNGHADLLFQNVNGGMGLWELSRSSARLGHLSHGSRE